MCLRSTILMALLKIKGECRLAGNVPGGQVGRGFNRAIIFGGQFLCRGVL
jgi:hypothetical protein